MLRACFTAFLVCQLAAIYAQGNITSDSMVVEGVRLHDEGKYREALDRFEQAIRLDGNNGNALYEAGNTCFASGDYKQAMKYADRVIKNNRAAVPEAYMLKGNALDMLGKPDKAIDVYEDGIRRGYKSHMLHFNLGVTLMKQKKYEEAEPEFIKALKITPSYVSAHYMLGYCNAEQSRKVKALLPLYYFLLIENEGKRADVALGFIKRTMAAGVEQNNKQVFTIKMDDRTMGDEFGSTDLALSMIPIARGMGARALKDSLGVSLPEQTFSQQLVSYNESLFKLLSETKEHSADSFWWDTYANFFIELQQKGHTEAFTRYILLNSGDKTALGWLLDNKPKLEAFSAWVKEYQEKN